MLSTSLHYFLPPKDLKLLPPNITKKIARTESGFSIELVSETLAKNVYLSVKDEEGHFSDNFFDILPGRTIKLDFIAEREVINFENRLKIVTLINTY